MSSVVKSRLAGAPLGASPSGAMPSKDDGAGGVAFRGADVARLLQHLLVAFPGFDFADHVYHGAARGAAASVFDHVDTRGGACSAALHCWKSGVLAMFVKSQLEQ